MRIAEVLFDKFPKRQTLPYLTRNNVSIHFQTLGQGEDLVLLHGLGANLAFWYMSVARLLARDERVVTYDLRGHGLSNMPLRGYTLPDMAGDIRMLMDHLGIEKAHLVGHSYGARVALYFTLSEPERTCTLTLADTQLLCLQPPVRLRHWPHWPLWKKMLTEQGFYSLPAEDEFISFKMLAHFNRFSTGFTQGALNRARRVPSLRHRDMGLRGAARWELLMKTMAARRELSDERQITMEAIRHLSIPTLAIFGEYSHCLPTCWKFKEMVPHCEVAILPEVGHFHPAIKPKLFAQRLQRFLASHRYCRKATGHTRLHP